MFSEKFEQLYDNIPKLKQIKSRKLKAITTDKNNIGFLTLNTNTFDFGLKNLVWIITSLGVKFSRVYLYTDTSVSKEQLEDKLFQNILKMFSDILVFYKAEDVNERLTVYSLIKENLSNNIFVFNPLNNYVTFTPHYIVEGVIYSLSYRKNLQKYSYNKSIFSDVKFEGALQEIHEESIINPLLDDFFIPSYTLKENWLDESIEQYNSLSNYLSIIFTINNVKKNYFYENSCSHAYNYTSFDKDIARYLQEHDFQKPRWQEVFPNYTITDFNFDLCNANMEIAFVNSYIHYVTVENINNIMTLMPCLFSQIRVVDNIDMKYPEKHIARQAGRIKKSVPLVIDYNNNNQIFEKKKCINPHRLYGTERFDQTLKHLIETTKADILYVIGDKIILNKPVGFDTENIWAGKLYKGDNSAYINIFNVKKMRELGIKFEDTPQFMEAIKDQKHEFIDYEKYGICLPQDFDKYNSIFFRAANTHKSLTFNYLFDKFNFKFNSFEYDYIRDNQL
jgi:hypothetical protein